MSQRFFWVTGYLHWLSRFEIIPLNQHKGFSDSGARLSSQLRASHHNGFVNCCPAVVILQVHLKRQLLYSMWSQFIFPLLFMGLFFAAFIPDPTAAPCTVYHQASPCAFSPQTTLARFKPALHPEFITHEMPFKKEGWVKALQLIVQMKKND